ncbi:MAG: Asd/ArgC dimerization domain-containing protein [Pseudomonadota bacterium]
MFEQTRGIFVHDPIKKEQFSKQIAFNVIPQIDVFMDDGYTKEEWKMASRPARFSIPTSSSPRPACACRCSSAMPRAINVEFHQPLSVEQAQAAWKAAPGPHLDRSPHRRGLCHAGRMRR